MSGRRQPMHRRTRQVIRAWASILGALVAATSLLAACDATATPTAGPPDAGSVVEAITEEGLQARLDALEEVSVPADGFRALGTSGYAAAADLVATELREAGWQVTEDVFTTPAFTDGGGSELVVGGRSFGAADIRPLIFAPGGDVRGPIVALDWDENATSPSGKGCAKADYGVLPDGAIVLVRSGPCRRRDQILAAQEAGAAGFVAGYPWAESGRVLRPTLIEPAGLEIPAVSASRTAGSAMAAAAAAGATGRVTSDAATAPAETRSIIAELVGSEPGAVVMLGAHLDSVIDGPGINDNGSGVAALLEIARALGSSTPRATIRLAFWAAEEVGLQGSFRYVDGLSEAERTAIVAYLNADMVASPNGFAGVYDEGAAAPGSGAVRDLVWAAVERAGGVPVAHDAGGGSDHYPFTRAGIATGGVFSGAIEPVTREEAVASGATAGSPADECYHQGCDDGSMLDLDLGHRLTDALADVAVQLSNDPGLAAP